ncbi:ABC transporter ATP-binding protein [uncultured Polaribacter sp.]|uniref:ABC transporter ATP-binding protein n=1 Tax=uncultured Polaribacter sp. TaxID=174711 RepID=UPI002602B264|nr:ABC transporter ATP-binding protein [uncultured Polaribacter sp.]
MKNEVILKVENLSKQYRLGTVGSGTISHDLNRFLAKIRGKEDPYLKIGESNDRALKGDSEYVWALKDINFEVKKGEVLGIIGKNGAGKSTLLKILSKVTGPSTGSIKSNGRIASLLEVGTGFHPEMTGKENIFLNGAILGMTKKEIQSKLNEIVSFSGCERYIDTPVKRYSSGMKVRLAFAVAAHLEPDILIVDEVLAVGDAEFQKKAIGKMQDISNEGGRTVLFVSHDMAAIQSLCTKGIVLNNGTIGFVGSAVEAIENYLKVGGDQINLDFKKRKDRIGKGNLKISDLKILDDKDNVVNIIKTGQKVKFRVLIDNNINNTFEKCRLSLSISSNGKYFLLLSTELGKNNYLKLSGGDVIEFEIPKLPLTKSDFNLEVFLESDGEVQDWIEHAMKFSVEDGLFYDGPTNYPKGWAGKTVLVNYSYTKS